MKPWQRDQVQRALAERRAALLEELGGDAARRRLADGSYGVCVDCGAPTPFERLHAEPAASRCVECQARHEKTYRR